MKTQLTIYDFSIKQCGHFRFDMRNKMLNVNNNFSFFCFFDRGCRNCFTDFFDRC